MIPCRTYRNASTTTLSTSLDFQSGFIHNLKWLSTDPSYYRSIATIDQFRSSQFYWMVHLSRHRKRCLDSDRQLCNGEICDRSSCFWSLFQLTAPQQRPGRSSQVPPWRLELPLIAYQCCTNHLRIVSCPAFHCCPLSQTCSGAINILCEKVLYTYDMSH